jgi:peptide/nickel transport system substrate-binding protein/oligopeptide transport system substrate-binding protein
MGPTRILSRAIIGGALLVTLLAPAMGLAQAHHTAISAHDGSGVLVFPQQDSNLWVAALDPAQSADNVSRGIIMLVYSGLVQIDGSDRVVPDLAAAMPTISPDRLTYTFRLRPNAAFSDGTPVTAQDVVYSITRALSKKEAGPMSMFFLGHIKGAADLNAGKATTLAGIAAPDPRTVRITLDQPIGYFLQALAGPASFVVKRSLAPGADLVGPHAQAANIGTGPFMFSKPWRYRQEMYLAPNPHWYNAAKLRLKEIDVPFVSTLELWYREYLSGEVPMTQVPGPVLASARALPDFHDSPQYGMDYLVPNLGKNGQCKPISCAPFNDLHFRRALMYAMDRTTITNKIQHGWTTPLCSIVPRGLPGNDDADLCKLTAYDPARARAEITLARKDFGGTIPNDGNDTLIYEAGYQDVTNALTELQGEWASVGIHINIKAMPINDYFALGVVNTTPLFYANWIDDYPDAQDFMDGLLSTISPFEIGNYNNPQLQKLLAQADITPEGPDRTRLYIQAQRIAINDAAVIMIGQYTAPMRWKSNIHGMYVSPTFAWQPVNQDWTNVSVD